MPTCWSIRLALAGVCLLLWLCACANAQESQDEPPAARIERLIAELDSPEYAAREAATKALENLGGAAGPALRKAAANSPSLEVRVRAADLLSLLLLKQKPRLIATLAGHGAFVNMVAFSPDGETLASVGEDGLTQLWKWKTSQARQQLRGHSGGLLFVAYSPDGKTLATCGRDAKVLLWEAESGRNVATIADHTGAVSAATFSPDGETLATAGDDKQVKVRDKNGTLRLSLAGHKTAAIALAFSPDGKTLISGGGDFGVPARSGELRAWNLGEKKLLWTAAGDFGGVWGLSGSPDGKHVAGACLDGTVRVWEVAGGKERFVLRGHTSLSIGVAYAPSGRFIASSSYDGTVRLCDAESGGLIALIGAHTGPVQRLAFSPDGKVLATCGNDRLVKIWQLPETAD